MICTTEAGLSIQHERSYPISFSALIQCTYHYLDLWLYNMVFTLVLSSQNQRIAKDINFPSCTCNFIASCENMLNIRNEH